MAKARCSFCGRDELEVDLVGERERLPIAKGGQAQVKVEGYGFRWLLVRRPGDRPAK